MEGIWTMEQKSDVVIIEAQRIFDIWNILMFWYKSGEMKTYSEQSDYLYMTR